MSISRRTAHSFLTQCQLGREGIASKRLYPATAARSSSPIPWRSPSSRLACTFARTTETSARSTVRLNAYKGSSFQRRECLLFTCSDYSGNDDTGLGPDVLDVVAVEIATAANFAAGGACRACGCARKPTRREFAFDDIGSRQTGDAEERRQIFGIAQCRGGLAVRKNACAAIYWLCGPHFRTRLTGKVC